MTLPDPIAQLPDALANTDPVERAKALSQALDAIPTLQRTLATARADIVNELKQGRTWDQVGELLGLHPARASQIARGVSGGTKRRPATD
ncbi:RNA polymerase subunit sigma-70 [Micromonospora tulbaghiae]|uniref:RNA polymerase subunit sigma-70 n=1 Tax=Micromonospora tulbaghiae TaxID=479978 RepID=A0A386WRP8_9ACTN|nr:RNA polymerase subunit sigma-70 [Micromonospora tulbaghiae]AYF30592.1 RNA polymerase subunit sigma-70 [Micromonospora tulbaghiae]